MQSNKNQLVNFWLTMNDKLQNIRWLQSVVWYYIHFKGVIEHKQAFFSSYGSLGIVEVSILRLMNEVQTCWL